MRLATASAVRACAVPSVFSVRARREAHLRRERGIGKRTKKELAEALSAWREKAMAWIKLMPIAMRTLDGSLSLRLPEPGSDAHFAAAGMVKEPDGSWRSGGKPLVPAAYALREECRRLAAKAAPHGFRVGTLLRFEHRLKRGVLPAREHYLLVDEAEFEVMEIELALGIDPKGPPVVNWNAPLLAGPENVLRVLRESRDEMKLERITRQVRPTLLAGTSEENKPGQVSRWIDELIDRHPPLASASRRKGYYKVTDAGMGWTGTDPESGT
jgi:hypothetical protein